MSDSDIELKKFNENKRQFDEEQRLRLAAFEFDEKKYQSEIEKPWYRGNISWLGPTLGALVAILSIVATNELESRRASSDRKAEGQRLEDQHIRELDIRKFERETKIILHATRSENEEETSRNLNFFIEAELITATPKMVEAISKFGVPTNVGSSPVRSDIQLSCESDVETRLNEVTIVNDVISGAQYCPTLNKGGKLTGGSPKFVVISYSANQSANHSVRYMMTDSANASTHLLIRRDGSVVQMGAFNERLWHAGASEWEGFKGLNSFSVGIMLENSGPVIQEDGLFYDYFSREIIDQASIVAVRDKNDSRFWQSYPDEQITSLINIGKALSLHYDIPAANFIGRSDISPGRKLAPGPAFPMRKFRQEIK